MDNVAKNAPKLPPTGMPRALLKLAKRSLPMIRLLDSELLVNNLIVLFV